MSTTQEIKATNLGPIQNASITLEDYGITVLSGPNGAGKSILLDAMQTAAIGKGKLPLRDHAKKGMLEAFGAVITIGGTTRHNGTFDVLHLEGRFDLWGGLVDPGIKDPKLADRHRIKSLVNVLGVIASVEPYLNDPAFADLHTVVDSDSLAETDPVALAIKIKKSYDKRALQQEEEAKREANMATADEADAAQVNIDAECDGETLQADLEDAVREETSIKNQADEIRRCHEEREEVKAKLAQVKESYAGPSSRIAKVDEELAIENYLLAHAEVERLQGELEKATQSMVDRKHDSESAANVYGAALQHEETIDAWEETLSGDLPIMPTEDQLSAATQKVSECRQAIEQGALARQAKAKLESAKKHKEAAKQLREKAIGNRTAAASVDEILSGLIQCDRLRVDSSGGETRLVTDHPVRGNGVPFHDLSDGEKAAIALEIGADRVGENGLLVIPQISWEGLDAFVRPQLHERAKQRKVYVLAAQATRDAEEGRDLRATHMDWQPMDTAPEPDEVVLGRNQFGAVFKMQWADTCWVNAEEGNSVEPTHWKPMPA